MKQFTTLRGIVATLPSRLVSDQGNAFGDFRLAVTERVRNKDTGMWEDGETNWFTVKTFNRLTENAYRSLNVGDPVVVTGRLNIRTWSTEEKSGTAVEIYADAIGPDLNAGYTDFYWVRAGEVPPPRESEGKATIDLPRPTSGDGDSMWGAEDSAYSESARQAQSA